METKTAYTPELRFPEFSGDWQEKTLGDICNVISEKGNFNDIGNYVSTENMLQNYGGVVFDTKQPAINSLTKYRKGDILFSNIRPYLKKVWQASVDGTASNDVIVFRTQNTFDECFVCYVIKNDTFIDYVMASAKGVKMPRGDKNTMLNYKISFPPLPEQRKIAACLSSLDSLIKSVGEKIDLLKQHKKGLMQKMFPKRGSNVPELRFDGFEGDWVAVQFGSIFNETKDVSKVDNEDTLLSSTINGISLNSDVFSHQRGESTKGYKKIKKNMLILSAQNLHLGNANVNLQFEHGLISPAYKTYEIIGCDPIFLSHWIKRDATKNFFFVATTEGASVCRRNVEWSKLYSQEILLPSLAEQKAIASCLTSLDNEIEKYEQKLQALQMHKKGLMQKMFVKIR
ncbi:MAG: restriction endonuclease subunit S [Bacteroidales bacterium]|nr:restriction endonuclease subunit S [Bacteroidales bacterium]